MNWNQLFFVVFPYISITLFIAVTIYRSIYRPFTISSLSSQLLERKKLYWGSIPFHHGILWILLFHLVALITPKALLLWTAVPLRLYLLEISGFALGLWALVGVVVLFSVWFTGVFTPYLWSILTLQPRPELVAPLPWLIQLHVFNNFALLAVFPFSRMVHILTWPLDYLIRPWQIVIWMKERNTAK